MTKHGSMKKMGVAAAAVAVALVSGCTYTSGLVQLLLNAKMGEFWSNATKKAQTEALLESKVDAAVDGQAGRVLLDVWYWPTVRLQGASDVDVHLGDFGPEATVPSLSQWTSGGKTYLQFPWTVSWAAGNHASLSLEVNISNAPDPDVAVNNLSAAASGTALVALQGTTANVTVFVNSASVDLSAAASVDVGPVTFSFDVSNEVKGAVKDALKSEVINKAFKAAFSGS